MKNLQKDKFLESKSTKNFLFRNKSKVNKHYIYTHEEIRQDKQARYLFDKIDTDKSGDLDTNELQTLFNECNIEVDID